MASKTITIKLTPTEAYFAWGALDGAADAGAGSNSAEETRALGNAAKKILDQREQWKDAATKHRSRP